MFRCMGNSVILWMDSIFKHPVAYNIKQSMYIKSVHNAVWQFRQFQTPEDGHIGPKHVVLSESGKKR
jgi:hypothetical protein